MRKHRQPVRPTNDSERSPAVHYANWKETIFLRKNLATISKTERGVVHRITVDQKVMFRRFQQMLSRSKLSQARVNNDRELIQRLGGNESRRLHCESHVLAGEDEDFLTKLKKNPCVVAASVGPGQKWSDGDRTSKPKPEVTDEDTLSLIRTILEDSDVNKSPENLRRLSALGRVLDAAIRDGKKHENEAGSREHTNNNPVALKTEIDQSGECNPEDIAKTVTEKYKNIMTSCLQGRPITTNNTRRQSSPENDKNSLETNAITSKSLSNVEGGNFNKTSIDDIDSESTRSGSNSSDTSKKSAEKMTMSNVEENNSSSNANSINEKVIALKMLMDKMKCASIPVGGENKNQRTEPLLNKRRRVQAAPRKRLTSIFDDVKRPDLHGKRLQEARRVDYSGQVRDFVTELSALGHGVPDFDYYASKMQMDAAMQTKPALPNQMPSTPDNVYRKYTGDPTISAITLPKLRPIKADDTDKHDSSDLYIFSPEDLFGGRCDVSSCSDSEEDDAQD